MRRVIKATLPLFLLLLPFPSLMLDFLVNSYIVVWILVHLLLSELCDIKSSITLTLFFLPFYSWLMFWSTLITHVPEADPPSDWTKCSDLLGWLSSMNWILDLTWLDQLSSTNQTELNHWLNYWALLWLNWTEPSEPTNPLNWTPIDNGWTEWDSWPQWHMP